MGTIAFGGFLLIAAGGLAVAGFQFAAADSVGQVPAAVRQTLAVLNHDFFFRLDGGVVVAVFATVAASLRHDAIPRWFGYLSVAVGIIFLTPFFAVAFPAFGIWTLRSRCCHCERRRTGADGQTSGKFVSVRARPVIEAPGGSASDALDRVDYR